MNVLIIGATGFIGKELVQQLALKDINLTLLVRNKEKALSLKELNTSNIQLITGDLTLPNLGLNATDKKIALTCNAIIHCGGPMDISLSKEEAKTAFLNGAKHVAELATEIHRNKQLIQFIHMVGYMSPFTDNKKDWIDINVFEEIHPLLMTDSFYEQMKFQADILMRQVALEENFPLIVINPPTVIGDKRTGNTEQLAGLGLFIKIIRQGLLPIVPGGKNYYLPVIHKDVLARFVIDTLLKTSKKSATYTLVKDQHKDLDLPSLMRVVTQSMNMKTPKLVMPIPVLKTVMTLGGSKITGVPKTSLNFLTDKTFDNQQVKTDFPASLVNELSSSASLPLVVADIDYTLTFGNREIAPFIRNAINQTSIYSLDGEGKTIVLVHGLFSEASDLFSLGIELHNKTGRPILIVDLPGFGRSPFKSDNNILNPYLDVIKTIQKETGNEATFIGHSFGAALLLEALKLNVISKAQQVILLQPPIEKTVSMPPIWLSKLILKTVSTTYLKKHFMKQGLFSKNETIPHSFFELLAKSFNSPRILNTNLALNKYLGKMTFDLPKDNVSSIWGTEDKNYIEPSNLKIKENLPFGHYFPISEPEKTAEVICHMLYY